MVTAEDVKIARSAGEIAAGVMPVNFQYEVGNVLRYGTNTVPGTTDMTTAVQTALNLYTNRRTAIASGEVILPNEGLLITKPLIYAGDPSNNIKIRGVIGGGRGGSVSSYLKWGGTAGGSMLILSGANELLLQDFNMLGNVGSGIEQCIHVSADNVVNTTLTAAISAGTAVVATPVAMTNIAIGMLLSVGAGGADVEHVYITATTGTTFTANFLNAHASGAQVGGSAGSSGVKFVRVHCTVPAGALTCGILWGNKTSSATPQISEGKMDDVQCMGTGAPGTSYAGMRFISGGNVKNFVMNHCAFNNTKRGVSGETTSGRWEMNYPSFAEITENDIVFNTGSLHVVGSQTESPAGHRFISGGAGANQCSVTVLASTWQSNAPADDFIIQYAGGITLIGNAFENNRTGSSVPLIMYADLLSSNSPASITSIGNWYKNATETTGIFHNGGNPLRYGDYESTIKVRVFSLNDLGGSSGALVPLTPMLGIISNLNARLSIEGVSPGITHGAMGAITRTYQSVVIPYTALQAAALTKDLTIFSVPARCKIVGIYADTTAAFAGPAGTLNLRVGTTSGGQELLLDHDVKTAAVTKGLADADLGVSITRAAAIQGGAINTWGDLSNLFARLTSSSGNLSGLTAGSVTLYVLVERML